MTETPTDTARTNGAGAGQTETTPTSSFPLFYQAPEVLRSETHGALKVDLAPNYDFARRAHGVPLNAIEFSAAARHYPIVFAAGSTPPAAVAVLGLRRDENLFVDANGDWIPDVYIPSYLRRYPFILARGGANETDFALCVDVESGKVGPDNEHPLFADGQPTEATRNALEFCGAFQREAQASSEILAKLAEHDLLTANEGRFTRASGDVVTVNDFLVVNEERFAKLPDAAFLDLRAAGALPAIYSHFVSMRAWVDLVRRLDGKGQG